MNLTASAPETVAPPRLSHRAAALRVVIALAGAGVLAGAVWALVVPAVHGAVVLNRKGERVSGYIGDEADRVFLAAALLVGFLAVLAVVAAVAVWQWRAHRGPVIAAGLTLGGLAAGALAPGVGAALARWRYGRVDIGAVPVSPEHRIFYTTEAPSVLFGHSPWLIAATVFFPAGIAALVFALCALASKRDDLDAWPPVEHPAARPPASVASPGGTGDVPNPSS